MAAADVWTGLAIGSMPGYYGSVYCGSGAYYSAASMMMSCTGMVMVVWSSTSKM